jgi:hypothetical protein
LPQSAEGVGQHVVVIVLGELVAVVAVGELEGAEDLEASTTVPDEAALMSGSGLHTINLSSDVGGVNHRRVYRRGCDVDRTFWRLQIPTARYGPDGYKPDIPVIYPGGFIPLGSDQFGHRGDYSGKDGTTTIRDTSI